VNDMTTNAVGRVTYWSCSEVNRDSLLEAIGEGLKSHVPKNRTDDSALNAALAAYCVFLRGDSERDYIVQPHTDRSKNGFEVALVKRRDAINQYEPLFTARCVKSNGVLTGLEVVPARNAVGDAVHNVDRIQLAASFVTFKRMLPQHAVGAALKSIATTVCDGVSLRPTGGIYSIPPSRVAMWRDIADKFESVDEGVCVYQLKYEFDEDAVRAVRDALTHEVGVEVERINEAVSDGQGKRALSNRKAESIALRQKVKRYETLLGETLTALESAARAAESTAATALLAEM
jgi:hypothetical protein